MHGRDGLLSLLRQWGLDHDWQSHPPVRTMAESRELRLGLHGVRCKNLLLRDKRGRLFLVVADAGASLDLKVLRELLGSARLSFASTAELAARLGVRPGALSPLALVNDHERVVTLVIDERLAEEPAFLFHPLDDSATVAMSSDVFAAFLDRLGVEPLWCPVISSAAAAAARRSSPRPEHAGRSAGAGSPGVAAVAPVPPTSPPAPPESR